MKDGSIIKTCIKIGIGIEIGRYVGRNCAGLIDHLLSKGLDKIVEKARSGDERYQSACKNAGINYNKPSKKDDIVIKGFKPE